MKSNEGSQGGEAHTSDGGHREMDSRVKLLKTVMHKRTSLLVVIKVKGGK